MHRIIHRRLFIAPPKYPFRMKITRPLKFYEVPYDEQYESRDFVREKKEKKEKKLLFTDSETQKEISNKSNQ